MTEREIAEKMIADAERIAKAGKDKLAELDKPKLELRHGDYGYATYIGVSRIAVTSSSGTLRACGCDTSNADGLPNIILGNIFADLKRNSEDLEEFEVDWVGGHKFSAKLLEDNCGQRFCGAKIKIESGSSCYTFERLVEINQNLGQLIATAKRKK